MKQYHFFEVRWNNFCLFGQHQLSALIIANSEVAASLHPSQINVFYLVQGGGDHGSHTLMSRCQITS
jgi:hypothetical protein